MGPKLRMLCLLQIGIPSSGQFDSKVVSSRVLCTMVQAIKSRQTDMPAYTIHQLISSCVLSRHFRCIHILIVQILCQGTSKHHIAY